MKFKKLVGRLLMAFLLVSVGFAIGKETALRSAQPAAPEAPARPPPRPTRS